MPRAARCCRAYAAAPRVALKRATPSPLVRHHRAALAPDPILLRTQSWVSDTLPGGQPYRDKPYANNTPYHKSLRADFGFDSAAPSPTPPRGYPPGCVPGRTGRAIPAVVRTPQLQSLEEHVRAGQAAQARPTPACNPVQQSPQPMCLGCNPLCRACDLMCSACHLHAPTRRRGSRGSSW